ncbi:alpha/beta fold hydrolase [Nocardioides panacisoli]|uniref:PGAP1-like alpha/beta domain-containing protein n=1 Tax=Nocardioides panacisoli TaxID=627624 RepID=UPI001C63103D|nr:alpha/beta hydrolase [Nocardioides panacisoli]QYJ04358.1 alpha/beta fold hydrolase [Nocardioides panacisoli]
MASPLSTQPAPVTAPGPTLLDALSLLAATGDELVVGTARDTHRAVSDRVHGLVRRGTGVGSRPAEVLHRGIATAVYGALGTSLGGVARGLDRWAERGGGRPLDGDARGRFLTAAVNGLIGDELLRQRPQLAIAMSVRDRGRDVPIEPGTLAQTFPDATGRVAVFLHGLCEDESCWELHREATGTTYPDALAGLGWTPVRVRYNSGLAVRENGAALSALLQELVDAWAVPVEQIALVGHSMGGLVARAAGAVVAEEEVGVPWARRTTDVVTLGSPHLGSHLASGAAGGSSLLRILPESAAFSERILERRSAGIRDLTRGLGHDLPPSPHVRHHLVAATVTGSARHPLGRAVGDLLVHPTSAVGRDRAGREVFADADRLHVGRTGHFGLLNHPEVLAALREWLR